VEVVKCAQYVSFVLAGCVHPLTGMGSENLDAICVGRASIVDDTKYLVKSDDPIPQQIQTHDGHKVRSIFSLVLHTLTLRWLILM